MLLVLYETSLALRIEHKLQILKKKEHRKVFQPQKQLIILHNEVVHSGHLVLLG